MKGLSGLSVQLCGLSSHPPPPFIVLCSPLSTPLRWPPVTAELLPAQGAALAQYRSHHGLAAKEPWNPQQLQGPTQQELKLIDEMRCGRCSPAQHDAHEHAGGDSTPTHLAVAAR